MKIRKILSILLVLSLLAAMGGGAFAAEAGLDNFSFGQRYDGRFTDVPQNQWYYGSVKAAYEYGLMNGKSASEFAPGESLTLAQVLTMAARLHSIYNGGDGKFQQAAGANWYRVYVDYALKKGILKSEFSNYNRPATRAEFADIFSRAIARAEYVEVNYAPMGSIPDVKSTDKYADSIYLFYRAGILNGKDDAGRFEPNAGILRSEAATVLSRIVVPENRVMDIKEDVDKAIAGYLAMHPMSLEFPSVSDVPDNPIKCAIYGDYCMAFLNKGQVFLIEDFSLEEDSPLSIMEKHYMYAYSAASFFEDGELFLINVKTKDGSDYLVFEDGRLIAVTDATYYYSAYSDYSKWDEYAALYDSAMDSYYLVASTWESFVY